MARSTLDKHGLISYLKGMAEITNRLQTKHIYCHARKHSLVPIFRPLFKLSLTSVALCQINYPKKPYSSPEYSMSSPLFTASNKKQRVLAAKTDALLHLQHVWKSNNNKVATRRSQRMDRTLG